jgi:hypothetical protein
MSLCRTRNTYQKLNVLHTVLLCIPRYSNNQPFLVTNQTRLWWPSYWPKLVWFATNKCFKMVGYCYILVHIPKFWLKKKLNCSDLSEETGVISGRIILKWILKIWKRARLNWPMVIVHPVSKFIASYSAEGSLPRAPPTGPCPEPTESSPRSSILFWDFFKYYPPF